MSNSELKGKYKISYLKEDQITPDYLETLNNKTYMRFSRHVETMHDIESQKKYLKQFDFEKNLILAITTSDTRELVATATLYVDPSSKRVNVGFLIIYKYSGKGLGYEICHSVINFTKSIFPNHTIEIGTSIDNFGMRTIAERLNFRLDRLKSSSSTFYYILEPEFSMDFLPKYGNQLLVVAHDSGGAAQIATLLKYLGLKPKTLLSGPAIKIFRDYEVEFEVFDFDNDLSGLELVLTGSGLYGGPESLILENKDFKSIPKFTLIDHWTNYKERFHPNGEFLPDAVLVSNSLSQQLAKETFSDVHIILIPDFFTAFVKNQYLKIIDCKKNLVVILEPDFDLPKNSNLRIGKLETRIKKILDLSREKSVETIVFRPHPSQNIGKISELEISYEENSIPKPRMVLSKNSLLVEDFASAIAVIGFHSYALYVSYMLGIETYSFFAQTQGHWTNDFPNILSLDNK